MKCCTTQLATPLRKSGGLTGRWTASRMPDAHKSDFFKKYDFSPGNMPQVASWVIPEISIFRFSDHRTKWDCRTKNIHT
ncbi:MAG: hypothetical protein DRI57_14165 [Deltaproteobacteria bacterium]|nr:MAG: hypothetical protein DRI57_14165 [Deltaproteobacteria bacterium]